MFKFLEIKSATFLMLTGCTVMSVDDELDLRYTREGLMVDWQKTFS